MENPENYGSGTIQFIHTIWNAALTGLGGLVLMFAKRMSDSIDRKADKDSVTEKFEAVQEDIKTMVERQDQMHADNGKRFDEMYRVLISIRNGKG